MELGKPNIKKQSKSILMGILSKYQFQSFGEFNALLADYNIQVEKIEGSRASKTFKGLIYKVPDLKRERKSAVPIKSSVMGKEFGWDALETHFKRSSEKMKHTKISDTVRRQISESLKGKPTESQFKKRLQKKRY